MPVRLLAAALGAFALLAVAFLWPAHLVRAGHLALALALVPALYRTGSGAGPGRLARAVDVLAAVAPLVIVTWMALDFEALVYRGTRPSGLDLAAAAVLIVLVLEAARRTTGPALPLLGLLAILYAVFGAALPAPFGHRGYSWERVLAFQFLGLEGLFGAPLAVSATFVALFALYGAVLDRSGAGRFFLDVARAAAGAGRRGAGRAVTLASFLLGGPSGSGVATTVTLGSVAGPLLLRAGYSPAVAGGLLAAGGVGAVLSPPVMGAAAFLMAELTGAAYADVVRWAIVPCGLYYLGLLLRVEADAASATAEQAAPHLWTTLRAGWPHIGSLLALFAALLLGFSPTLAAIAGLALALLVGLLLPAEERRPRELVRALEDAGESLLPVAAACATAGILVGALNLTGLGLKLSGIVVQAAGGSLAGVAVLSALSLIVLGLALPITASYAIAAVTIAPALVEAGAPVPAAHLFVFTYAVLSEVSPPTALSCHAVAAQLGASPNDTMRSALHWALPAFLVPFAFLAPGGELLLLEGPAAAVALPVLTAALGLALLVAPGVLRLLAVPPVLRVPAGLALLWPAAAADAAGALLLAAGLVVARGRGARA
ncbi:MAG: TRAP transporter fused permease subunit [Vicinamibacteria bacterium]|nr:TRAP transporter fused permease subunit [Vicinamibacteria bacterium]